MARSEAQPARRELQPAPQDVRVGVVRVVMGQTAGSEGQTAPQDAKIGVGQVVMGQTQRGLCSLVPQVVERTQGRRSLDRLLVQQADSSQGGRFYTCLAPELSGVGWRPEELRGKIAPSCLCWSAHAFPVVVARAVPIRLSSDEPPSLWGHRGSGYDFFLVNCLAQNAVACSSRDLCPAHRQTRRRRLARRPILARPIALASRTCRLAKRMYRLLRVLRPSPVRSLIQRTLGYPSPIGSQSKAFRGRKPLGWP